MATKTGDQILLWFLDPGIKPWARSIYYEDIYTDNNCTAGEQWPYPPHDPNITINIPYPPWNMPDPFPQWEVVLKIFVYSVAMAMAVIGNLLVLYTIAFNKGMHNSTFLYIGMYVSNLSNYCKTTYFHCVKFSLIG